MENCQKYLEKLIDGSYQAMLPQERTNFEQELSSDPKCKQEFDQMEKTLVLMETSSVPDPGKKYWDSYWENISPKIDKSLKPAVIKWPGLLRAAAFIASGLFLGYLLFSQPQDEMASTNLSEEDVRQVALSNETMDLLEDSKILLLGIVNLDTQTGESENIDFSFQKEFSGNLLRKAADLKELLKDSPNRRVINLLSELELIMMQITNLENKFDLPAIEVIQGGADEQSLLFKIDLERMLIDAQLENPAKNKQEKEDKIKS